MEDETRGPDGGTDSRDIFRQKQKEVTGALNRRILKTTRCNQSKSNYEFIFSKKSPPEILRSPGVASVMYFLQNGIGVCDRWVESGRIDSVGSGQSAGNCCWGNRRDQKTSSAPRKLQSQADACFGLPQLIHRPPDPAGT